MKVLGVFFIILLGILYVLLLPFPIWVVLPLHFFGMFVSHVITVCLAVIELAIGVFFLVRQYGKQKKSDRLISRTTIIVLSLCFLVISVLSEIFLQSRMIGMIPLSLVIIIAAAVIAIIIGVILTYSQYSSAGKTAGFGSVLMFWLILMSFGVYIVTAVSFYASLIGYSM